MFFMHFVLFMSVKSSCKKKKRFKIALIPSFTILLKVPILLGMVFKKYLDFWWRTGYHQFAWFLVDCGWCYLIKGRVILVAHKVQGQIVIQYFHSHHFVGYGEETIRKQHWCFKIYYIWNIVDSHLSGNKIHFIYINNKS